MDVDSCGNEWMWILMSRGRVELQTRILELGVGGKGSRVCKCEACVCVRWRVAVKS